MMGPIKMDKQRKNLHSVQVFSSCCCCLPTPLTLVCGRGESDHPVFGPPASLSFHLASSSSTPAGYVNKSRGDNVGAVEEMVCVVCVGVTEGA